jgi:hypothetical protein
LLAIAWEALGEYDKSITACKQVLESLAGADSIPPNQKLKARQEAENRMKAAILKQLAAPAKSADPLPPAATNRWKSAGSNPDYPALSGQQKSIFYINKFEKIGNNLTRVNLYELLIVIV